MDAILSGDQQIAENAAQIALSLRNLKPEITAAGAFLSERIGDQIEHAADLFPALAESTVQGREYKVAKGEQLVAGLDTPLRAFHDSIYLAATALREGVPGSAFAATDDSETIGINDQDESTPWMRRVLLGDPSNDTPARDAVALPETDIEKAGEILQAGVSSRIAAIR